MISNGWFMFTEGLENAQFFCREVFVLSWLYRIHCNPSNQLCWLRKSDVTHNVINNSVLQRWFFQRGKKNSCLPSTNAQGSNVNYQSPFLTLFRLRRRLHELFHPGMSFTPGWPSSHPGMTFTSVSGHLLLSVYMIWSKNVFAPGWSHPGLQHRDEIIPGRTHFCSKSCKRLQVNEQTPRWK